MNISIIGAGPVGNYAAYLLSRKGLQAEVYEEHSEIGRPVQCTGILSSKFKEIIKPKKEFVINKTNKARIYAPNNKFVELRLRTNYILDRTKFDSHLAKEAEKNAAKINLNTKFLDFRKRNKYYKLKIKHNDNIRQINTDYLIGADGPVSQVAKSAGVFDKRKFLQGMQVRANYQNDNAVEFFPYVGTYAWIVPENKEIARIGLASYSNTKSIFEKFTMEKINKKDIIDKQGGLIPMYNPHLRTQKENIYLVGDAATQVKATTGGGIIPGLIAAKCVANAIIEDMDYHRSWKRELGLELYGHLAIRKMMDKFKYEDWNKLIDEFDNEKLREILQNNPRDNILSLGFKSILHKPSMLRYMKFFF
ncbi:NAD(P)/FAD-dependent oxidoreductase [Candidatus Woesearchaeota archaeon]|nr:NAD(P)/FAD-dependent oxidoreductase [Candidatus Woesearchaeota archaeon]